MKREIVLCFFLSVALFSAGAYAQRQQKAGDSLVVSNKHVRVVVNLVNGLVSYRFSSGVSFENTVAYLRDIHAGLFVSAKQLRHTVVTDTINDPLGRGICINLFHETPGKPLRLIQYITVYASAPFILLSAAGAAQDSGTIVETRDISPLTVLPEYRGRVLLPGSNNLFTDYPFDNDNWVDVISRHWPFDGRSVNGTSYELASAYDRKTSIGFVAGSLVHDFWKTGIQYGTGTKADQVDSLVVYGGAATKDSPALPDSYGGKDGTHDYVPHGTQAGQSVYAPLIYLSALGDVREDLFSFGSTLKKINGMSEWSGNAPFYWNSFAVEGVLGHKKVMMPADVAKISDYIRSLKNINDANTRPVLSIDSYDQDIYTTDVLKAIGRYAKKNGQQIGFYFIPFALWTWKNNIDEARLTGTDHLLREVILLDGNNRYVPYKDGDWGAFPLDPTHPYTRDYIIGQLKKAKAIDAKFIKIDFLSAGALESERRYDPKIRSGIQAYNYGMKMLRRLVDSIMGPDIFITQAISPLFPNQYAHTRFLSTDVYSHLRNDMPDYPHYGSTCASMISAANFWWVQGNLWPYTNMDVVVMKRFQQNREITEQEVKLRLFSMITLGSILGDGSDYRDRITADRGRVFLDNKAVCSFFRRPKAFTPLRFPEGNGQDQQMSFFLRGDTIMVSAFNFDREKKFTETFQQRQLDWRNEPYILEDFLTGKTVGRLDKGQTEFSITVDIKDAVMLRLYPLVNGGKK